MLSEITRELRKQKKIASGNLINKTVFEVIDTGSMISLIGKAPEYYYFVDKGRRKGKFPPINKIQQWIKQKGLTLKGVTLKQAAFLISRKIAEKGIKGTDIYTNAITHLLERVRAKGMEKALMEDLKEETMNILHTQLKS